MDEGQVVPLQEHMEKLCCAYREAISDRINGHAREHELMAEALGKAEAAVNERLGRMNEFREQIHQERESYVTREVMDTLLVAQSIRISALERSLWLGIGAVALAAFLIPLTLQFIR